MFDWDAFPLARIANELRRTENPSDAEKMVWAFERALEVARVDPEALEHLLAATASLLAAAGESSPREILERRFRRSVSDELWRKRYLPLFA